MSLYVAVGAVAALVASLGVFLTWRGFAAERKRGTAEAERDHYQSMTERSRRANEIDEDVVRLSDADLDRELHNDR